MATRKFSFHPILANKNGEKTIPDGDFHASFEVNIDGPSPLPQELLKIQAQIQGIEVSFPLTQPGAYFVSVLFKGKHFTGSPFKLEALEKPAYRRDYELVGDAPAVKFGKKGFGYSEFEDPYAVTCNSRGELIVTDSSNHRIQVFDQNMTFLFCFGGKGWRTGLFSCPRNVAVDPRNDQIMVAEVGTNRIQIFDDTGNFLRSFGTKENLLNSPRGIAVDESSGNYLVTDQQNSCVRVFNPEGEYIRNIGSHVELPSPYGIGVLSDGSIVVSEWNHNKIVVFDPDGTLLREIAGNEKLNNPRQLFVDSDDNILVADYKNKQIVVLDSNGNEVKIIGKGRLSSPSGVCVDNQGRIFVSERTKHRISLF